MRHIQTQSCAVCLGTCETIRAGIREDCRACNGHGVTVHEYETRDLILDPFDNALDLILDTRERYRE